MFERRMSALVAAVLVLLASAVLWNLFVRPAPRARSPATPESQVESVAASPAPGAADTAGRPAPTRQAGPPPPPPPPPPPGGGAGGARPQRALRPPRSGGARGGGGGRSWGAA